MNILISGSVAFDYLMTFPGYFRDHILPDRLESISLSFLVESMVRMRGGVAPNIAYTLALLGEKPRLWATVGEDFTDYRNWLESHGINTSDVRVIPGDFTASFFVNTDRANSQIASFYPGAMAHACQLSLRELQGDPPDLVLISPNEPAAMIQYTEECRQLGLPYIFDPSQQIVRLNADELRQGMLGARAIFVNEYEAALIENMTGITPQSLYEQLPPGSDTFLVITEGKKGVSIYTPQACYHIDIVPPVAVIDPTGVGDAFRGGFLSGVAHQFDLETCGKIGVLAATYCLEQRGPQGHYYTIPEFIERFRVHFDDKGILDQLYHEVVAP